MFATLISVALFSSLAIKGARADFTLDTPALVQCQPATLTWSNTGSNTYNVIVVPSDDVCGDELADLGDFTDTTTTWTVAVPAGQNVTFSVQDQWDNEAWSGSATVGPSDDASCLSAVSGASSAVLPTAASASHHASTAKATGSGVVNAAPASSSGAAQVVGAASSGDGTSAGFSMHQLNAPVMILSALAALAIAF
ncbi:uncharacterized protein C8Q71DRAFT_795800 [Rhodofomes roseus]|uniref:Uncharacterized protein n=1 Tax=Rhodofomes roseus TaxID=34475 RepID=A0A4Y9Y4G0_9APHY|nr:uncharacterized protein C8Q71DRAFT_795800 [Rhodofomes roseus]KAH9838276.1 hypothetical protein C8Q71DRAFT_795800 [Rhodofomes roseus]TFY57356.1 hypothetical protein EVJ58_g7066 [Rhodofomes roseus]